MPLHTVSQLATAAPWVVPGLHPPDMLTLLITGEAGSTAIGLAPLRVLDGQHVALLAASEGNPSADVFRLAALALGARIARIAPADLRLGDSASADDTARMLGRLYAVIGCAALEPKSVALLLRASGVPVLHELAAATHASRLLADLMTMQQTLRLGPLPPVARPLLGIHGAANSALLRAWQRVAASAGVEVMALSASGSDARAAACHFVCRPGAPPELWAVEAGDALPRETSLAERQRRNHVLVVEVLLRNAWGARR